MRFDGGVPPTASKEQHATRVKEALHDGEHDDQM
jgi:hypothetical protein